MSHMLFDQRGLPNAVQVDFLKNIGSLDTLVTVNVSTISTVVPDLSKGNIYLYNITANVAVTIGAPINAPVPFGLGATFAGCEWTLMVQNSSGGALGTPPAAVASTYRQAAFPVIATGTAFTVTYFWEPTSARWVSVGGTSTAI